MKSLKWCAHTQTTSFSYIIVRDYLYSQRQKTELHLPSILQTSQKVFRIVPKCTKMANLDASLSERTCFKHKPRYWERFSALVHLLRIME